MDNYNFITSQITSQGEFVSSLNYITFIHDRHLLLLFTQRFAKIVNSLKLSKHKE